MTVSISGTNGITFPDSSLQAAAASPYVLKNRIINGAFQVSQRGTTINSINTDYTYTADRWLITRGGSVNYTQGTTNPPTGFQYYGSYINQTASNPFVTIQQVIESTNTYDLLGQTVTLSAWIKAAANTAASTSVVVTYGYATTADTRYTTLVSGTTFAISSSAWTKCSITFTVPSNALTIVPVIYNSATLAVGDGYLITGVQLEIGSTATPFERRLYNQELANCQRYFYKTFGQEVAPVNGATYTNGIGVPAIGTAYTTSSVRNQVVFPQPMRTTPTVTYFNSNIAGSPTADRWTIYIASTSTWTNSSSVSNGEISPLYVSPNVGLAGLTIGYSYLLSGFLTASAEL